MTVFQPALDALSQVHKDRCQLVLVESKCVLYLNVLLRLATSRKYVGTSNLEGVIMEGMLADRGKGTSSDSASCAGSEVVALCIAQRIETIICRKRICMEM